ncbi:protein O-mannose kinase-like isoform X2 [Dendronephthya gigantea]|nr:protein O-mannose kinase-like isoform X2 [Dendronephthya gigantea]
MVTTYYHHGSADKLDQVLPSLNLHSSEEIKVRIQLVKDYLKILEFLHDSPLGVRVMCDANDLTKTLSQFLISDKFHLVINDLDALPKVDHQLGQFVKCGHRELFGWFVAPEQLWPYDDKPFNDFEMPEYDEKIDIWRVPNVVIWFLGDSLEGLRVKAKLKHLFNSCKATDPKDRPSATEVLRIFEANVNQVVKK